MPEDSQSNLPVFSVAGLPHVQSAQFVSIYSNNVGLAGSFYDAMLMFGHIVPNYAGSKEPHIEDTVGDRWLRKRERGYPERAHRDLSSNCSRQTLGQVAHPATLSNLRLASVAAHFGALGTWGNPPSPYPPKDYLVDLIAICNTRSFRTIPAGGAC
jgi:hypothetical protein